MNLKIKFIIFIMNYLKNIIENNTKINYFILTNISKEILYNLTKNSDLRFLKYTCNNLYKLLLKSFISGFIIKLHNWDNNNLINEYNLSQKLKNIINFNNYLCYFEYELNFINYILDKSDDDLYNDSSIVFMHNYHNHNISYISENYINNIYIQFVLALYSAFYNYNVYFNSINIDLIYIVKNYRKRKYKYFINNKNIILNDCKYKLIISDISDFNILDNTLSYNIDDNILNMVKNLNIFNKTFEFTKKKLNTIKKKYIS